MKSKRIIAIISLISIILCFLFVIKNINHECNHNNCPICEIIKKIEKNITAFTPPVKVLVLFHITRLLIIKIVSQNFINNTLISLKVELIN